MIPLHGVLAAAALLCSAAVDVWPDRNTLSVLAKIQAEMPRWTFVQVSVQTDGDRVFIREPFLGIELSGSRQTPDHYGLSGRVGQSHEFWTVSRVQDGRYNVQGMSLRLEVVRQRNYWRVSGSADMRFLNASISRWGGGYVLRDLGGASLDVQGSGPALTISGNVETSQVSPKALAAVATALVVVHTSGELP